MRVLLAIGALIFASTSLAAQSFTCPYGARAACLDYGDKVCGNLGKCVDQNAECFANYQCNYEGFTCKSNLTECADEYEALLRKFNSLVVDYNNMLVDAERLQTLLDEANDEARRLEGQRREVVHAVYCAQAASSLDEALTCLDGY